MHPRIDYIGAILELGFITALIIALQWGGNQKPWNSGDVIGCLVASGVCLILFAIWEVSIGDRAMVPTHLLKRRTQIFATLVQVLFFVIWWA